MPGVADLTDIMAAYSSGRLPQPLHLLMETRARLHPDSGGDALVADVLGGDALELTAPVAVSRDLRARTMARVQETSATWSQQHRAAEAAGGALAEILALPEPLRSIALQKAERQGWRFAGPGVRTMEIARDGATAAELIRLEPGSRVPVHSHEGVEYTLVLTGSFHDGRHEFARGDLCIAGPDVEHTPVASDHGVCIALAVTDAPLEFRGALGLLQKVLRLN